MNKLGCNAFNLKSKEIKFIGDVLTTSAVEEIKETTKPPCGGLLIDSSVFKIDKKTKAITKKENDSVEKVIKPYCGGLLLDDAVFELVNKKIDLKAVSPANLLNSEIESEELVNINFSSLDKFEVTLKDSNGNIIEPVEKNTYKVNKNEKYKYEASNGVKTIKRTIDTTKRNNINETITF